MVFNRKLCPTAVLFWTPCTIITRPAKRSISYETKKVAQFKVAVVGGINPEFSIHCQESQKGVRVIYSAYQCTYIHGAVVFVFGLGTVNMVLCTRNFDFDAFDLDPLIYHVPHLGDLSIHMLLPHFFLFCTCSGCVFCCMIYWYLGCKVWTNSLDCHCLSSVLRLRG